MIKLIIFDLDGVLIDAKAIHKNCLDIAIREIVGDQYCISEQEHLSTYDGLKTKDKLSLLTKKKGLPEDFHKEIFDRKQRLTQEQLKLIKPSSHLVEFIKTLRSKNYKLACCSNSIRNTIYTALSKLDIIQYFDLILSNEDVVKPKPFPEIYWQAMSKMMVGPNETLIFEDSPHGIKAAELSGAYVVRVKNTDDLVKYSIEPNEPPRKNKWKDHKMNVLIPMAGAGSRFEKAGYTFPKPLIEVNKKPMIQVVVESLNIDANYIYIVQKSHREKYFLDNLFRMITPNYKIIEIDGLTEGAACTTLLAKKYIDNESPLVIANSDQYIEWDSVQTMYKFQEQDVDAGILTFESSHPKWSYVKTNYEGEVIQVAEKQVISNLATCGVYFWKHGSDYVKYAEQMISKNIRVNGEFYVCPVFNEAIQDGKIIRTYEVDEMLGLGTPEDLNEFLRRN